MKINKTSYLKSATRRRLSKPAVLLAFILTGLFVSACAGRAPLPASHSITERAQHRWDALLAGEFETAYAFYSPGYRSSKSVVDFAYGIRMRRVHWTSAQYKEHSCLENTCTVLFDVGFTVRKPVPGLDKWDGSQVIEEKWIKTGGQWWFLPAKK